MYCIDSMYRHATLPFAIYKYITNHISMYTYREALQLLSVPEVPAASWPGQLQQPLDVCHVHPARHGWHRQRRLLPRGEQQRRRVPLASRRCRPRGLGLSGRQGYPSPTSPTARPGCTSPWTPWGRTRPWTEGSESPEDPCSHELKWLEKSIRPKIPHRCTWH